MPVLTKDELIRAFVVAQRRMEVAAADYRKAVHEREQAIVNAKAFGVSYGRLAAAAGITRSAVQWVYERARTNHAKETEQ